VCITPQDSFQRYKKAYFFRKHSSNIKSNVRDAKASVIVIYDRAMWLFIAGSEILFVGVTKCLLLPEVLNWQAFRNYQDFNRP
jgi:hypothetical protein